MMKAAFFDIDGTLVPYDTRCLSQADCSAIEALRKQGTLIFIVTGRHFCDIDNIPFPVNGAVCSNGALTYVVKAYPESFDRLKAKCSQRTGCAHFYEKDRFALVEDHPIPQRQAVDIARIIADNRIPASASIASTTLSGNLTQKEMEFIRRVNMPSPRMGNILETAIHERIYNFNAFVSPEEEKRFFHAGIEPFNNRKANCSRKGVLWGLDSFRWCDEFCDINVKGLDKVLGINKILNIYHISPADIIAFGDGYNDIAMLKLAGCGIAMETAADEVKNAADYVTASANDSGVSKWLSPFLETSKY